MSITDIL